jgi:hypothetical protein
MSSFICFICNTPIIEDKDGIQLTDCPHHPLQHKNDIPDFFNDLFGGKI